MAPHIPAAKITLSYPLYACDFDIQDPNRLAVGGGGGAGRSGVGNKITLLDVSRPDTISQTGEIELSRDEDNVTSLAVGPHKGRSLLVYAGVNSSPQDQQKGKNEHFRLFSLDPPSKAKAAAGAKIAEVSRRQLFTTRDQDAYQRLLRLSAPYQNTNQVGAVATGFAKDAQIVVFDVSAGGSSPPKTRGVLELSKEATDLDIIQTGDDQFQLAYCDDYEIKVMNLAKGVSDGPKCIYTIPAYESIGGPRPSFRSIRYLTPSFILAVSNLPKRGGALVHGLRLPTLGEDKARLALSSRLPKSVAQATGLAVRNLSPAASPSAKVGDAQFVVAVAGHDASISVYTLEHQTVAGVELISQLLPVCTLPAVHPLHITGLALSFFSVPKTTSRAQSLKLASVSVGNTVVAHTLPLKKFLDKSAPIRRGGPPRQPRYVLALRSKGPTPAGVLTVLALAFAVLAVALQAALELSGAGRPVLGVRRVAPASWVSSNWRSAEAVSGGSRDFLSQFLAENKLAEGGKVLLREGGAEAPGDVQVVTHDAEQHGPGREWEELPPKMQAAWKKRLEAAGHWTEEMGETIFKGVLFSEIAGAVGAMAGG